MWLKTLLKRTLPPPLKKAAGAWVGRIKMARARAALTRCVRRGPQDEFLPSDELGRLMRDGYTGPGVIRYDPKGLELRAREKIDQIRARVPLERVSACLELGCMDGMVALELAKMGKKAFGLDLSEDAFDARAREGGVRFVKGNAEAMPLEDASMDLVYSFAAFEHFEKPDRVLSDSARVLKKGGFLYLLFGPVYTSAYGRHAYRQIPVPYCHFLFKEQDLVAYARGKGLYHDWPYVNGWSVSDYRKLWNRLLDGFRQRYYKEHPTGGVGAELIARYPQCFRGKVSDVNDLFVSAIELCWEKR